LKPDITSRTDIETFIAEFYERVKLDPSIGFIFNEVARIDWEKHIPIIVDFWETILLDNPVYKRNAMDVHYDLNKRVPLQKAHFDSWLKLFNETVDACFEGKKATLAKTRAKGIADVMLLKMYVTRG
jgi:hemoglobin